MTPPVPERRPRASTLGSSTRAAAAEPAPATPAAPLRGPYAERWSWVQCVCAFCFVAVAGVLGRRLGFFDDLRVHLAVTAVVAMLAGVGAGLAGDRAWRAFGSWL